MCAVVAISKPATLLPFGLPGSMPSFRSVGTNHHWTLFGFVHVYIYVWVLDVLINIYSYKNGQPIHVYQLSLQFDFSVLY